MLTEQYLANLSDELVELYSTLEYEIKRDMVKRLAKLQKITDATEWSVKIFNEVGGLRSNIDKFVEQYDAKAQSTIKRLFYQALQKNESSNMHYMSSAKRNMSDNQKQALTAKLEALEQSETAAYPKDATIDKLYAQFYKKYQYDDTFKAIKRMTMTIADTSQEEFIRECNNAYMKVSSGAFSYQQALKQGVDQLATTPVKTIYYTQSGSMREYSIEAALRMNIITGVNQIASQQTLDNAEELGVDQYEVSAHIGARWSKYAQNVWSNHSEWQGKIYTREQLETVCGLGYADGLCGINCRHSFYPYIKGMPKLYSKDALEKMNEKTVSLYGKQVPQYEAEQELRKTERAIRTCKRKAGCEEVAGIDNTKTRVRLGELQQQARKICSETGIKRDYSREYVGTKTGEQVRSLKTKAEPKNIELYSSVIPKQLKPENTDFTEVEKAFESINLPISDGVKKLDAGAVAEVYNELSKINSSLIGFNGVFAADLGDKDLMQTTIEGKLILNKRMFSNMTQLQTIIKTAHNLPENVTIASLTDHEVAHSMERLMTYALYGNKDKYELSNAWNSGLIAYNIFEKAIKDLGLDYSETMNNLNKISELAAKGTYSEKLAECFDYCKANGDNTNILAKTVKNITLELMDIIFKGGNIWFEL